MGDPTKTARRCAIAAVLAACSMSAAPALAATASQNTLEAHEFDRIGRVFAGHGFDLRKSGDGRRGFGAGPAAA